MGDNDRVTVVNCSHQYVYSPRGLKWPCDVSSLRIENSVIQVTRTVVRWRYCSRSVQRPWPSAASVQLLPLPSPSPLSRRFFQATKDNWIACQTIAMPRGRLRKSGYYDERPSACCSCWKDPIYLVVSGIITCVIAGSLCITFGLLYQPSRKLVDNRLARVSIYNRASSSFLSVRLKHVLFSSLFLLLSLLWFYLFASCSACPSLHMLPS